MELPFQDRPHRSPVDPGSFHRYVRHLMRRQPIPQRHQIPGHGPKHPDFVSLASLFLAPQHTSADALLVHIQSSATSMNHLHGFASWITSGGSLPDGESPSRAHPAGRDGHNSLYPQASRLDFFAGLSAPLNIQPVSGRHPWPPYSSSSLFSSFVVTGTGHGRLFL